MRVSHPLLWGIEEGQTLQHFKKKAACIDAASINLDATPHMTDDG